MSGYVHCACRDCMEIAIQNDKEPALCSECKKAGCSINDNEECCIVPDEEEESEETQNP